MADTDTSLESGNGSQPGSNESIGDIVNDVWPDGTKDLVTPPPPSAPAETVKGDSDPSKTAPPAATKPVFFSDEEIGKLTLRDVENPGFDWSKVPPGQTAILKGWQAGETRLRQQLAEARRTSGPQKPPQPTEAPVVDPQDKANREIVEGVLKELGLDPSVVGPAIEDQIYSMGVRLASQDTPRYGTDAAFQQNVHDALAADADLAAMAESKDPRQIARAIKIAATAVERQELASENATFKQRAADLDKRDADLKAKEVEIEQQRTKLNRQKPSVSGGATPAGAPTRKPGETLKDDVDQIWPAGQDKLRVG